jgi:hypothetical protein
MAAMHSQMVANAALSSPRDARQRPAARPTASHAALPAPNQVVKAGISPA